MTAFNMSAAGFFRQLAILPPKMLYYLMVPGGLMLLMVVLFLQSGFLLHWLPIIAVLFPVLVMLAALIIGWRFNRSRLVFAVLVLLFADRLFFHLAADGGIIEGAARNLYNGICLFLPLNLIVFYSLGEKGLFSANGLLRVVFIVMQPLFVDFLCSTNHPLCASMNMALSDTDPRNTVMSQPGMLAFAVALLFFLVMFFRKKGNFEHGFLWSTVAAFVALYPGRPGSATTIYFAAAGLILVAAALEDAYCMAFRDELTGLPARRALNETLLQLPGTYAVAMLDIDFFKKFNDTHGHDVGDQVLCMVAARMAEVGGGGKAFRYGGEEFTVLFPGREAKEAVPHLEELRKTIEVASFYVRSKERPRTKPKKPRRNPVKTGAKLSVTISIGVAEPKGRKDVPLAVIKAADKALYRAKKKGRNQVST